MKRIIEITDKEEKFANEIYKMLVEHPDVQEIIKKQGYVDLRIKSSHWIKILHLLTGGNK